MVMWHNRSEFSDKQLVKLQETPGGITGCRMERADDVWLVADAIPDGETPHTINMCVFDDLVDVGKPGDRVEVTGACALQRMSFD